MKADICCVLAGGPGLVWPGIEKHAPLYLSNGENLKSPCECYQDLLQHSIKSCNPEVICFIHDDVTIHDSNWLDHVMITFEEHPNCVAVGLGGAVGLGNKDLYRKPFEMRNMARIGYASNQTDAEVHGERCTTTRRVAVLDAFFMAIRRDFLLSVGGWPVRNLTHHVLDLWLACEAARAGKEIWMVGVNCTHHGGGTSTKPAYKDAKWLQGGSMEEDHIRPHRWLWDAYKDVLPIG